MQTTQITIQEPVQTVKRQVNKSSVLIDKLKSAGFRVYVRHLRQTTAGEFTVRQRPEGADILPRGGSTYITIETDGSRRFKGRALCHPNDNYDRNIGRFRALSDALHSMKFTDPELHEQISELFNK